MSYFFMALLATTAFLAGIAVAKRRAIAVWVAEQFELAAGDIRRELNRREVGRALDAAIDNRPEFLGEMVGRTGFEWTLEAGDDTIVFVTGYGGGTVNSVRLASWDDEVSIDGSRVEYDIWQRLRELAVAELDRIDAEKSAPWLALVERAS